MSDNVNVSNLQYVKCESQLLGQNAQVTKSALLNIRSITNKSYLINDFITAHGLYFMLLTETWLNECSAETILIESALPSFINVLRAGKKGGGVPALCDDFFQCK